jgi:hypothetical protein
MLDIVGSAIAAAEQRIKDWFASEMNKAKLDIQILVVEILQRVQAKGDQAAADELKELQDQRSKL